MRRRSAKLGSNGSRPAMSSAIWRSSQGLRNTARPAITPSAPDSASARRASATVRMSPLASTGIPTARFTALIAGQSAVPLKPCERVRPCTVTRLAPASSARRAISGALRCCWSHPSRILTVKGMVSALPTACRIASASRGSRINAAPDEPDTTFLAGQPRLRSTKSAPRSSQLRAACAMRSGERP